MSTSSSGFRRLTAGESLLRSNDADNLLDLISKEAPGPTSRLPLLPPDRIEVRRLQREFLHLIRVIVEAGDERRDDEPRCHRRDRPELV